MLAASLIPTEVSGVGVLNAAFEAVVDGLRSSVLGFARPEDPQAFHVPPVISRALLERLGYVDAFPNLLGTLHTFVGDNRRWRAVQAARLADGAPWHSDQTISDVVALPATCYHLYPLVASQTLAQAVTMTAEASCYRHEGSSELGRLRSFRMREIVRIGGPDDVPAWRDEWLARARTWFEGLGLTVSVEVATDPFFGDAARMMAPPQRQEELKWELKADLGTGRAQAIASANYHKDHFGGLFGIQTDGDVAHTACAAFGLERIVLALIAVHGAAPERWPASVRGALGFGGADR
ncbi:aminoacyl--tRNA ligase-related protein [Micromonospora sp. CA-240977]|uniref:aminoacyl--tRNA ligase-related protein n=1 Tax=Micromonospora sp. CA-240977 TaxID=3239957 RepID=UPI003D8DF1D0